MRTYFWVLLQKNIELFSEKNVSEIFGSDAGGPAKVKSICDIENLSATSKATDKIRLDGIKPQNNFLNYNSFCVAEFVLSGASRLLRIAMSERNGEILYLLSFLANNE